MSKTNWTAKTRKALATGGWVNLHTQRMTLVVYLADDEEPLVTTREPWQLPTWEDPWFRFGTVSFSAASHDRLALGWTVSNDQGEDLYVGGLEETIDAGWDFTLEGIEAGIEFAP